MIDTQSLPAHVALGIRDGRRDQGALSIELSRSECWANHDGVGELARAAIVNGYSIDAVAIRYRLGEIAGSEAIAQYRSAYKATIAQVYA